MRRKTRRRLSAFLAALLVLCMLPSAALAKEWHIENGNITINPGANGQQVQQGSSIEDDSNPVITSSNPSVPSTNTINVEGTGDATFTIKDLNIQAANNESAIVIGEGVDAEIKVEGENTLSAAGDAAAIQVAKGELTVTNNSASAIGSSSNDTLNVSAEAGAAIGSSAGAAFDGTVIITGDVAVEAQSQTGAAIGSGKGGDFNGSVSVENRAEMNATGQTGAAIGSGQSGDFTATGVVNIAEDAKVCLLYTSPSPRD